MTALVQIDVTDGWERARSLDVSRTAFVVACVGRAVATHPEVHAYRDWLGRLVVHRRVNVTTMVEVETPQGWFPLAHSLRDAHTRSVDDLSSELRSVRAGAPSGPAGRGVVGWGAVAARIPGVVTATYRLSRRSARMRERIGTVAVSSVGMMMGGNGVAIGVPALASLSVFVGGADERPWVVDGEVRIRRILDVSVTIDHRVVDGAPAARFGATLRTLLEDPDLLEW
ncbi:MAG: 2-oxo acid dehydrogenase subunit E2 [Acidimicrobiia bacterium]|nr:2-oxo acid dehydrogenase subunit E2 [Acidimicrobiia bacterium]MDH4307860.1 2-oxo acid dehydrogenase subunit E2 [Acidimicrobiia bacterium]MDH5292777.1 2-oxo acid dehydrogenase subunit E2 [Acidimicrobiia bacterium]